MVALEGQSYWPAFGLLWERGLIETCGFFGEAVFGEGILKKFVKVWHLFQGITLWTI
jgi:hypothetical protein